MKRASGIDISAFQEGYTRQDHHDLVISRATYGTTIDSMFLQNMESTSGIQFRGAYHYLRYPALVSIASQVQRFLDVVSPFDLHFYACDFEQYYNRRTVEFAEGAEVFCYSVTQLTGKPCLLYSNPDTIETWMFDVGVHWVRNYPDLWIAQWPFKGWSDVLNQVPYDLSWRPWLPEGCKYWRFWQYSGHGNRQGSNHGVNSPDVDLDVFNGSVEEMRRWLGMEEDAYKRGWNDALAQIIETAKNLTLE